MNTILRLIFILLFSSTAYASQDNTCPTSLELKKFSRWVKSIHSYKIKLNIVTASQNTTIRSKLTGIRDKFLKIELVTKTEQFVASQIAVYDGKNQWVESKSPMGVKL